jgi:hypothetical protein
MRNITNQICSFQVRSTQKHYVIKFVSGYVPLVVIHTSLSFPHSWLITGFITRSIRRVPLVEQELLTLPEHLSSPPVFSGVRVTRSLVLCVCFVDRCLSFCTFSFSHCVVCSCSIYGFWYPFVSSNSFYGRSEVFPEYSTNKTDLRDIAEILFKAKHHSPNHNPTLLFDFTI